MGRGWQSQGEVALEAGWCRLLGKAPSKEQHVSANSGRHAQLCLQRPWPTLELACLSNLRCKGRARSPRAHPRHRHACMGLCCHWPSNSYNASCWACRGWPPTDACASIVADGHTVSNAPDLFRPPKLSGTGPGQYWGGGPPGKPLGCCQLLLLFLRQPDPKAVA